MTLLFRTALKCKTVYLLFAGLSCLNSSIGQVKTVNDLNPAFLNWYNRDPQKDNVPGTSVDMTYDHLLHGKKAKKTIIVAVIDSGVDIEHEDLKERIWTNAGEIAGNSVDDDGNGYIDDIHGWNFIGNKNGENVRYETMEYTRIYKAGAGPDYARAKQLYDSEYEKRVTERENILKFDQNYQKAKEIIISQTGVDVMSEKDLDRIDNDQKSEVMAAKRFLSSKFEQGFTEARFLELINDNDEYLSKFLNTEFNPRVIVGDNPLDIKDTNYGNPDVKGPRSDHGTAIAGVIGAVRGNGFGIDGIATDVQIMCLRTTPRGDERDKDVALAIKYAVDHGANIINLSFGKAISPQKEFVDQSVKLAEKRGVLIVHASGNSGQNVDVYDSYPSDRYLDGTEASNWLNVGATGSEPGENVAAVFSNYGKKHVDIFAPGQNVISTDSSNTYSMNNGTSLAAPVVSGIAALILSYFPDLTPQELIGILLDSSFKIEKKVYAPELGTSIRKKVKFESLSKSGGVVNAYMAMQKAESINK